MPNRPPPNRLTWIEESLEVLERRDLRRRLRTREGPLSGHLTLDGTRLVNFGSNDYLDLSGHAKLTRAAVEELANGVGSGASPLIAGRTGEHARLEAELALFEQTEATLLFASGFAACSGTIPALVERGDVILADAKNHASLIDGCRLSHATTHVYRHNDPAHLRELLEATRDARQRLIVTDTLFSMDGDTAPLPQIAELADAHDAMLLVDEAHATGVFGPHGRGLCEAAGIESRVDVKIGTLSKALGCSGGFVAGSRPLVDWLSNRARSYVFSTAPPPVIAAAARAALKIVRNEPSRREQLRTAADELRERLRADGWDTGRSTTQVIPIYLRDAARTMAASEALRSRGLFVPGIRPPSVPEGESLLRVSLCATHDEAARRQLLEALATLK